MFAWERRGFGLGLVFLVMVCATPARAAFHFMQIEQIIGGVNGDTSAQAIQLRLRFLGQNLLGGARMRAWDAAGANPIIVVNFATSVPTGTAGARVLIASTNFLTRTSPAAVPNFTMAALIPESYLAAGSLTFESDGGFVYWRVSWGGAAYTGSCTGGLDNDSDGNFCPAYPGPLPSCGLSALKFSGTAGAESTNNAAQYALTAGPAIFNNNAGTAFTIDATLAETGKINSDGDVDNLDYLHFVPCMGGPDAAHLACECIDADADQDIDLFDFAEFQVSFTG